MENEDPIVRTLSQIIGILMMRLDVEELTLPAEELNAARLKYGNHVMGFQSDGDAMHVAFVKFEDGDKEKEIFH